MLIKNPAKSLGQYWTIFDWVHVSRHSFNKPIKTNRKEFWGLKATVHFRTHIRGHSHVQASNCSEQKESWLNTFFFGLKCIGDFYLKVQNIVFYDNERLDLMTKTSKQEKLSRALKTLWKHFVNQVLTFMSLKLQIFLKPNESSMNKFHGDLNIETLKKCFLRSMTPTYWIP